MNDTIIEALSIIQEKTKDIENNRVLLAGGAVRDYLNNKEHRIADYDIFIQRPLKYSYQKTYGLLPVTNPKYKNGSSGSFIKQIIIGQYKDIELNLIFIGEDPVEYIKKYFDIGFCECWLDPATWDFGHTKYYEQDAKRKTLTCRIKPDMTEFAVGRSLTYHLPKIHKKYPDFHIKIFHHSQISLR